jgi:ribA/ribD-fused uncharacterized protein
VTLAKFSQDEALQDFFFNTKRRVLVEASPRNPASGIGLVEDDPEAWYPKRWKGLNLLGFALICVRTRLMQK